MSYNNNSGGGRYNGGGGGHQQQQYHNSGGGGGGRHNHINNSGGRSNGYRGGGGGGRYQGSGGRGGRGSNAGSGGPGGGGGGRGSGLMLLCRDFTSNGGQCPRGTACHFKHVVQLHASVLAATKPAIQSSSSSQGHNKQQQHYNNNNNNNYNNHHQQNNANTTAAVTSIAIWEQLQTPGQPFKIFTSSSDGYWRLWNTAGGQFIQEFENNMAGIVHKCIVSYDHTYLFCGFEAVCRAIPAADVTVGMVHGWNLQQPSQPPLELQIQPMSTTSATPSSGASTPTASNTSNNNGSNSSMSNTTSIPYAHNMAVSALHMANPATTASAGGANSGSSISTTTSTSGDNNSIQIVTGSRDGSIRCWGYHNGIFVLIRTLCGHAREVTGLVLLSGQNLLWSASIDHCIRIWNLRTGDCQYCITGPSTAVDPLSGQANSGIPSTISTTPPTAATSGHTMPITCLIPYISAAGTFLLSASLDRTVKVWNAITGECVMSEMHNDGIICMTIARDLGNNELLLLGMENGSIQCRNISPYNNVAAFQLLFIMSLQYTGVGHDGPVKCITAGPSGTFYTGGAMDGKMLVFSFSGDLGLTV